MIATLACPRCHGTLPDDAPRGLCPACLLAAALGGHGKTTDADGVPLADEPAGSLRLDLVRYFGDYAIEGEIARGGMGVVYRARQISLNRPVALKMILAGQVAGGVEVARFRAEAEAAAALDHPNIVPIHEVGQHQSQNYFSMKLIDGGSLSGRAGDFKGDLHAAARLIATVARAVHHAHQRGILHRDLKPANILVDERGSPHVTDFGLARHLTSDSGITRSGAVMGTPSYMAPEQAGADRGAVTIASDVYGLGAILYELLTGRPPFRGDSVAETLLLVREREPARPRGLNPAVDRDLETICLKSLEKEPRRRYESAEALAEDLERWLSGEPIAARPVSTTERALKWARRRPAIAGLLAAVMGVGFVGMAGILFEWRRAELALIQAEDRADAARRATEAALAARNRETRAREAAQKSAKQEADARLKEAEQKQKAEAALAAKAAALERADGLRLAAEASAARHSDPALGLLLGLEGIKRAPSHITFAPLYASLADCREVRTIEVRGPNTESWRDRTVTSVAYSADGTRLLSTSKEGPARVWDAASGKLMAELDDLGLHSVAARFSPDGARIVTTAMGYADVLHRDGKTYCYTDRMARLWDTRTGREITHLRGHTSRIVTAVFSPDSRRVLTASWDGSARLWDAASGKELRVFQPVRPLPLLTAQFDPDGRRILTVIANRNHTAMYPGNARDNGLMDPDVSPGAESGHHFGYMSFSANASPLGEAKVARLWDADSGKELATLSKSRPSLLDFKVWHPTSATFRHDGRQVAVTFEEKAVGVWDTSAGGKELGAFLDHDAPVIAAKFGVDGNQIVSVASGSSGCTVQRWAIATGKAAGDPLHFEPARFALFHPTNGSYLLGFDDHTAIVRHDAQLATERAGAAFLRWVEEGGRLLGHSGAVMSSDFAPDGRHLVTGGDSTIRIWETGAAPTIETRLEGHTGALTALAYSPDGRRLLTAGKDGSVRIWDTASGKMFRTLGDAKTLGEIRGAEFSADGQRVVTASRIARVKENGKEVNASSVHVWDAETGADIRALSGHTEGAVFARLSPDGRRLVTVADGGTTISMSGGALTGLKFDKDLSTEAGVARTWDTTTGTPLATLPGMASDRSAPVFSPDGRLVLVVDRDVPQIRLCETETGRVVRTLKRHKQQVQHAVFSPDGTRIATASEDGTACLWDSVTGAHLAMFKDFTGTPTRVAFSSNGARLAVAAGSLVFVWDTANRNLIATIKGHEATVTAVAFSSDGKKLLTASHDRTAASWDASDGRMLALYLGHNGSVALALFSRDGQRVVTGSDDGSARIWPVDVQPRFVARLPRGLTDAERRRYDLVAESAVTAKLPSAVPPPGESLSAAVRLSPNIVPALEAEAREKLNALAKDTNSGPDILRRELAAVAADYPATPAAIDAARRIATLPSPLDQLDPQRIPADQRFAWQPKELVAVAGDHRARHWDRIERVAYFDGGRRIITGGSDNATRIWDAETLTERATIRGTFARLHPNGPTAATVDRTTVRFWDLTANPPREVKAVEIEYHYPLAISPDLKTLVRHGPTKALQVLDISGTRAVVRGALPGHEAYVMSGTYSADGKVFASADQKGTILVWDMLGDMPRLHATIAGLPAENRQLALSPDGATLVANVQGKTMRLWDVSGSEAKVRSEITSPDDWINVLAFAADGKSLAVTTGNRVRVYDVAAGKPKERCVLNGYVYAPDALAFSEDGTRLATGDGDGSLRTWDISGAEPRERPTIARPDGAVIAVALAPDGRSLATLSGHSAGWVWELSSGSPVTRGALPGAGAAGAFTADGRQLITLSGALMTWDLSQATPRLIARVDGHRNFSHSPHNLDLVRGGRLAATIGGFPSVRLWDLAGPAPRSLAVIDDVDNNRSIMGDVALAPDGSVLAVGVGQWGPALHLWRITPGGLRRVDAPEVEQARRLAFAPDGKTLAVSDGRDAIRLLDLTETVPSERAILEGHPLQGSSGALSSLTFDGEGSRLLSAGRDGRVVIWDAATGALLQEWRLPGLVRQAVFASDGRHVATANGNGTAYILRIPAKTDKR